VRALALLIFPARRAQAVIAGLKCPPETLPPNEIAIASAATIISAEPVNDTAPINKLVPRNSTNAGVYIVLSYTREMKYLIVKGWLGFGDRLESLKMCVAYAKNNNLQIYVDWTDSIWTHGNESFYSYFKLVNVPILNSIDDIPSDATVYPPFWKDKLKQPLTQEIFDKQTEYKINIGELLTKYDADVVVCSSIGKRTLYNDSSFFANIFRVIDPRITEKVKDRQSKYNLKNCIGIHIRGTDRIRPGKRDIGIQHLAVNAAMGGGLSGSPMVVVSDDKDSTEIWKRFFPQSICLTELGMQESSSKGNHNASKESISSSKDLLNVDMLVDFFALASCQRIMTTYRDSRFAAEARRLHPFVNMFL
jgi:hypothetical protein